MLLGMSPRAGETHSPRLGWTGTRAPTRGLVVVPDHVDPTNFTRVYDLDDPAERKYVYEIVLADGTPEDIENLIHRSHLRDLWDRLYLPRAVRRSWQTIVSTARATEQPRPFHDVTE
jgi:hypothetical protein